MTTKFCGHKNGFNRTGDNDVTPTFDGVTTKFSGRAAVPAGTMSVPKGLNAIENGNRRLAKSRVGAGGAGSAIRGNNAFTKGRRT